MEKGKRELLQRLIRERFGPLSERSQERLQSLPAEQLDELVPAVLKAQSLKELGLDE